MKLTIGRKMFAGLFAVVVLFGAAVYTYHTAITELAGNLQFVPELAAAGETAAAGGRTGLAISMIAMLAALAVAVVLGRNIGRKLSDTALAIESVAAGDLTLNDLPVRSSDEIADIAQAVNRLVRVQRALVATLAKSAESLLSTAGKLSGTTIQSNRGLSGAGSAYDQLVGGAAEQSRLSQDVTSSMQQLQQTIQQIATGSQQTAGEVQEALHLLTQMVQAIEGVASNALTVRDSTMQATQAAKSGRDLVARTVEGMSRIKQVVGQSADRIRNLEQLSTQIGKITQVISDISDKTNMLALNAAIEAARAGVHGQGFAVVAQEVRNLAERSDNSAQEIADLITNIQARTTEAVKAMEAGTDEVEHGSKLTSDADQALQDILAAVEKAATDVEDITTAAEQVRRNAEHVVKAFDSVAAVTEENTAATEEMAAASDEVMKAMEPLAAVTEGDEETARELANAISDLQAACAETAISAEALNGQAADWNEQVSNFRIR